MKLIKKIVYGVLICIGVGLFLFYFFQEKFLFLPGKKLDQNLVYQFPQKFEEVTLQTSDQQSLNALHFQLENPKGIVLFFHGNKGNLQRWGKIVPYLLEYNYEVFVMDYRGYGKSTGSFDQELMYKDAKEAYKYVNAKFSDENIVVYGRSLGSTFAAKVGQEFTPKHVVLEAPFYNMKRATQFYFSLSPTFLLKYPFRTDLWVPEIKSPVTIFHGDEDRTTSFEGSKKLFALVKSEKKEFVPIATGTHHNLKEYNLYQEKLRQILN